MIQLRERDISTRERWRLGCELQLLTRETRQHLIVNDRIDLALLLGACGVHLTEASVAGEDARRAFSMRALPAWISQACHAPRTIVGADAMVLAPIYATQKPTSPLGVAALEAAHRLNPDAQLIALGGVTAANARDCVLHGASGVAAIAACYDNPAELIAALGIAAR
jgi:thiamine-phosphate pyrophosphorylase